MQPFRTLSTLIWQGHSSRTEWTSNNEQYDNGYATPRPLTPHLNSVQRWDWIFSQPGPWKKDSQPLARPTETFEKQELFNLDAIGFKLLINYNN